MGVTGNKLMNKVKEREEGLKRKEVGYKGVGAGGRKNLAEQFNIPNPSFYK